MGIVASFENPEVTDAFTFYLISRQPPDHLLKLVSLLASGDLSPKHFEDVWVEWGLRVMDDN
jgi:hypothetical protein